MLEPFRFGRSNPDGHLDTARHDGADGWVDWYIGDVLDRPETERRTIRIPSQKLAFHYLSLHRTLIQRLPKPDTSFPDEVWQTICETIRRRQ